MTSNPARRAVSLTCLLALVLGALAAALPASAGTSKPGGKPRPDLAVPAGAVALSNGALSGSFTVKAKGRVKAGRSTASLSLSGPGGPRAVSTYAVGRVKPGKKRTVQVAAPLPAGLAAGTWTATVCADSTGRLKEKKEGNNCRAVGTVVVGPTSSVPTAPIGYAKDTVFLVNGVGAQYYAYVPASYDASHQTPTKVLVWMHGCGGYAEGDASTVSPGGAQDWISISVGGRDGACWQLPGDSAVVLAALADLKTHFNVDPRRVVVGGYSSGGDLAYRTAFYNARTFAGVIAENTSPFRDTGSTAAQSLGAAAWRFPVYHLAHLGDEVYPIGGVRQEVGQVQAAGHLVNLIERPGGHYDDPGPGVPGTDADLRTYLLPALGAGWLAPS